MDWSFGHIVPPPPGPGPAPAPHDVPPPPGGPMARMPGHRMTPSAKQAYDEYMQNRLMQQQQQAATAPHPKHTVVEVGAAIGCWLWSRVVVV